MTAIERGTNVGNLRVRKMRNCVEFSQHQSHPTHLNCLLTDGEVLTLIGLLQSVISKPSVTASSVLDDLLG